MQASQDLPPFSWKLDTHTFNVCVWILEPNKSCFWIQEILPKIRVNTPQVCFEIFTDFPVSLLLRRMQEIGQSCERDTLTGRGDICVFIRGDLLLDNDSFSEQGKVQPILGTCTPYYA
jgi:hypothetical protein